MTPSPADFVEPPPVAAPTSHELWLRYSRNADPGAENQLVEQYLPLVKAVVGRLAMTLPPHVEFADLHSAGMVGLVQAMRNYDPKLNVPFESYARVRIRGAVFDELRRMNWMPRSIHERARKIQEVMGELEQKFGRAPSEIEMAAALGMTLDDYQRCLDEIRPAVYVCLDTTAASENGDASPLHEAVADSGADDPSERAATREMADLIARRLREMPEMQRKVMALYYEEGLLLREIALTFGLTESRICQIHAQAILSVRAFVERYESGRVVRRPRANAPAAGLGSAPPSAAPMPKPSSSRDGSSTNASRA